MGSKFCPSCGKAGMIHSYCNFCGYNSLFWRSGVILEKDETITFVCRVLEGYAQVPIKKPKSLEIVGANVLRLFTYIGGAFSESQPVRTIYLLGEMVVTSKRLIFINDIGFFASKPVCAFLLPLDTIVSVGVGLPNVPFLATKSLLITYKSEETLYVIDIRTDIEPEKVKSYIERTLSEKAV